LWFVHEEATMTRSLQVSGFSAAAIALVALGAPIAGQTRSTGVVSGAAQIRN